MIHPEIKNISHGTFCVYRRWIIRKPIDFVLNMLAGDFEWPPRNGAWGIAVIFQTPIHHEGRSHYTGSIKEEGICEGCDIVNAGVFNSNLKGIGTE